MTSPPAYYTAVIGTFDGVHLGHQYLLDQLYNWGHGARVAITFDRHPLEVVAPERAPRLLTSPAQKLQLLQHYVHRTLTIPFDEEMSRLSPSDFLRYLKRQLPIHSIFLGYNNRFGHNAPTNFDDFRTLAAAEGIKMYQMEQFTMPDGSVPSSTAIRKALEEGNLQLANAMLGRPYQLQGAVVHGLGNGHSLGFPTANLLPDSPRQLLPANGVYIATAHISPSHISPSRGSGGFSLPALVNIGTRPTLTSDVNPTVEAFIPSLPAGTDLYGRRLSLNFLRRLRPERRFSSTDELKAQIAQDLQALNNANLQSLCQ